MSVLYTFGHGWSRQGLGNVGAYCYDSGMNFEEIAAAALAGEMPLFREGSSRDVYEVNGWVFKVDHVNDIANAYELANLIAFNDVEFPDYIRIPDHKAFRFGNDLVIAMEFVEGRQLFECFDAILGLPCECDMAHVVPAHVADFFHSIGITDIGAGNVIVQDGIYTLIDAAE